MGVHNILYSRLTLGSSQMNPLKTHAQFQFSAVQFNQPDWQGHKHLHPNYIDLRKPSSISSSALTYGSLLKAWVDSVWVLHLFCRLLSDMVMHFPVSQEEITLSMNPLRVSLTNYYDGGNGELTVHTTHYLIWPRPRTILSDRHHELFKCFEIDTGNLTWSCKHCIFNASTTSKQ